MFKIAQKSHLFVNLFQDKTKLQRQTLTMFATWAEIKNRNYRSLTLVQSFVKKLMKTLTPHLGFTLPKRVTKQKYNTF